MPRPSTRSTFMNPTVKTLLLGTLDEHSPLAKLSGHADVIELIYHHLRQEWAKRILTEQINTQRERSSIAFAHVNMLTPHGVLLDTTWRAAWPSPTGRHCNMMPFVMGDITSLPKDFRPYYPIVEECLQTLPKGERERVGYLTVHESVVEKGASQRRPGLHTPACTAPRQAGPADQARARLGSTQ